MKIINSCSPGDKKSNFPFKVWSFKILNEAFLHRSELNIFFCDVPSDVTSVGRLPARQPRWTQFESRASTCFESEDGKLTFCSPDVVVFVPNRFFADFELFLMTFKLNEKTQTSCLTRLFVTSCHPTFGVSA